MKFWGLGRKYTTHREQEKDTSKLKNKLKCVYALGIEAEWRRL